MKSLVLIYNLIKDAAFIQKLRFNLELIKKCSFLSKFNFNL